MLINQPRSAHIHSTWTVPTSLGSAVRPPQQRARNRTIWTTTPAHGSAVMAISPAHLAVEHEDLPRLRDLLDAGHDVEDDSGDGWTLLRHAIDVEYDGHVQTGRPLHADLTAFLLARGADPLRTHNGIPAVTEAQTPGHS